jgi:hypothetical protein
VTHSSRPPALPRRLLERFVPHHTALAGDLEEEHRYRRSAWWYWHQALAAIAIHITAGILVDKLATIRAIASGWTALWLFSFVGVEINRFMSGWLLDRLILLFWTHPFPMMWATQLWFRPALALGFLVSGWVVGQLHHSNRSAMVVAFTATVLLWTAYNDIQALMRNTQTSYPLVDILFTPLPLLIVVGGLWGPRIHLRDRLT